MERADGHVETRTGVHWRGVGTGTYERREGKERGLYNCHRGHSQRMTTVITCKVADWVCTGDLQLQSGRVGVIRNDTCSSGQVQYTLPRKPL